MSIPFREYHIFQLLEFYETIKLPIDLAVSLYYRKHKSLGSKDRKRISEITYALIRWRALLDYIAPKPSTWQSRYQIYTTHDLIQLQKKDAIPLHIRVSFPKKLFEVLKSDYGEQQALQLCIASNQPAPVSIRVNSLKISREDLITKWENRYSVEPSTCSKNGIIFSKREPLCQMQEFRDGFFEIQDEGSQLIAELISPETTSHIFDYCAGAGGKALAIAAAMKNKGQLYLHDIRDNILKQASKRLKRAGVQNAQTITYQHPKLKKLQNKMDWVLADVPCSGTGTLRRNPDMKWKFDAGMIERLVEEQRTIFKKALFFLKPKGKIIYATCSLVKDENEHQIDFFLKNYPLTLHAPYLKTFPQPGKHDGFFAAVMSLKH